MLGFIIIVLLFGATVFWLAEIVSLMSMSDGDFPGRFDKPMWAAIIFFAFFLGALAFWIWKLNVKVDQRAQELVEANRLEELSRSRRANERAGEAANALGAISPKGPQADMPQ
jgi:hypothetical protein